MSVSVWLLSEDTRSERRFPLETKIENLKGKIELITGIPVGNQLITVLETETDNAPVATLDDDSKPLGFYGVRDWQFLKVHDTNPSISFTGQLTDVSQVDKFELSEAEYAKRDDTVLAYKQLHKVGRFAQKEEQPSEFTTPSYDIPIGSRCEIQPSEEGLHKRGTVRFFGSTKFGKDDGVWVGVEYDEPFGKNDGSVQGERYFTCLANYGSFVRPDRVKIGDYPVIDDLEDEEM